jgi:DNA-directed RNA polymerase subunit beta'
MEAMLHTTAGQLAVNELLPEEMRDHARILDKKGISQLLQEVAEKYPDKYRDIAHGLSKVGYHSAYHTGGHSFDLTHMRTARAALTARQEIETKIQQIHANPHLSPEMKDNQVIELALSHHQPLTEAILHESKKEGNPLAEQVTAIGRGNPVSLKSLRGSDLMYVDHKDRPIPIPILRSYSEGLEPVEYYAGTFGARKGVMDTKFATQDAGALSKQFNQLAHRLVVTKHDHDDANHHAHQGMPVELDDPDNEGALLAYPAGGYPRNTVLRPKILSHLKSLGLKNIVVRSPITTGPMDGGLYARDVGYRERGGIAPLGDNIGIAAAQALSEPLAQAQLSSKHSGGIVGAAKGVSGFKLINQLTQVPKTFKGGAAHAQLDGRVSDIEVAPQGGNYIVIGGQRHYVGTGYDPKVKRGDEVEAGDVISDGTPNPAEIVRHKGIGEGRRYFVDSFRNAYKESGLPHHRRNIEVMARGLIDHVRLTEEHGQYVPGDIVSYSRLEHSYKPREGSLQGDPKRAMNHYLEKPVLHYSIGTKIRPSTVNTLQQYGIKNVVAHPEPPPFEPEMIRGMENLSHDPDWMVRFLGSYQEKNLLRGVHRGDISEEKGTSYVPALSRAVDFGKVGPVQPWKPSSILKS